MIPQKAYHFDMRYEIEQNETFGLFRWHFNTQKQFDHTSLEFLQEVNDFEINFPVAY